MLAKMRKMMTDMIRVCRVGPMINKMIDVAIHASPIAKKSRLSVMVSMVMKMIQIKNRMVGKSNSIFF